MLKIRHYAKPQTVRWHTSTDPKIIYGISKNSHLIIKPLRHENKMYFNNSPGDFDDIYFCQTNQLDANGKKDGKWIVYIDKDWKNVDDSTKVHYRRYTHFDYGTNIYPMGQCGGKGYRLEGDTKSRILNGEYKWFDGKGQLSSVHVFNDGEYVSCKEYFPTGELSQHFDYTKKCEGQPHGWTVFIYDKKGNLILTSPTCKDQNGNWPKMRG